MFGMKPATSRTRRTDDGPRIGRYLWAAIFGLAVLSTAAGALVASSWVGSAPETSSAERTWQTGLAASDLLATERRVASDLVRLATEGRMARLADGVTGSAERELADATLQSLRGSTPSVVTDVCVISQRIDRQDIARTISLAQGPGAESVPACGVAQILAAAGAAPLGEILRERMRGTDGRESLLLATPLTSDPGSAPSVLVAQVDLAALLATSPSAVGTSAGAMLVDVSEHQVVGRITSPHGAADGSRREGMPSDVQAYLVGILSGHAGTARLLAEMGWTTTFAPVLDDGSVQLGIVRFWDTPARGTDYGPLLGVACLGAIVLIIATGVLARRFMRPVHSLAASEAMLQVLYREARDVAAKDGMTDLGNHRAFRDQLARQTDLFFRHGVKVVLLMIDLDDLKAVNDADGHAAGDAMIEGFARTMREVFRDEDHLFRIGGDEFAVLMVGADVEEAAAKARRLLHFASRPRGDGRPCTFSCGISSMPRFATDATLLHRQADAALYWVKRHGRASVEVFDPDRDAVAQISYRTMDSAVYEVIRGRALTSVFQPIVHLGSGAVIGFEGLIRPDPSGPLPDPGRLFAAAMTTGRTVELDIACLGVVSAGAHQLGTDRLLSVNLSPKTLEVRDFEAAWLLDGLIRNRIDPRRVIVEVTERDPIGDLTRLRRNLDHLQEYGIRLAADDVGAGNSGLRLLSQVQFDIVKIDMTLVQEGAVQIGPRAVLRSINDLAMRQEALVIAEGVETQQQLEFVQGLGIHAAQGYLLGRPSAKLATDTLDLKRLERATAVDDGPGETAPPPMPPMLEPAPRMTWPVKDLTAVSSAPGLVPGA